MSLNHHRLSRSGGAFPWCQWRKRELTVVAAAAVALGGLFLVVFPSSVSHEISTSAEPSEWVSFLPLTKSAENDAVCLDGSPPGYHMTRGFGSGASSWLLHVEGGGWCNTVESCSARQKTKLGSSNYMESQVQFSGILSQDPLQNPDFFNWNKVKIRYCDGASFAGNPESEFRNGMKVFFRGRLIWDTIMKELLSSGMSKAKQALLTGCSAGGLATLIHCDNFRNLLPKNAVVKCLADAGFFSEHERYNRESHHRILLSRSRSSTECD